MRKRHSAAFKAKLVQEMLKEDKSLTRLAAEHGVHQNQLREWKKTALDGVPSLFEADKKAVAAAAGHEQQVIQLYAEIGRLTTQVAWLKKIWPRSFRGLSAWRASSPGTLLSLPQ